MSFPKYLLYPVIHVQVYTHKYACTPHPPALESDSWLPKKQCGSRLQNQNHTLLSNRNLGCRLLSPDLFIWGPFALEVVTADPNPCRL